MAGGYEFLGLPEVLRAYEARDVNQWAIFCQNRFIMKGEGVDTLKNFLSMISKSGTMAIYTLKVYEDLPDGTKVNSKTADDGSFNFKLYSLDGPGSFSGIIGTHYGNPEIEELRREIGSLKTIIAEGAASEPEPTFLDNIQDVVIGLLENPDKLNQFIGIFTGKPVQPARIGHVAQAGTIAGPDIVNESNAVAINEAFNLMGAIDPDIVPHFLKLADIARADKTKFLTLITLLNSF